MTTRLRLRRERSVERSPKSKQQEDDIQETIRRVIRRLEHAQKKDTEYIAPHPSQSATVTVNIPPEQLEAILADMEQEGPMLLTEATGTLLGRVTFEPVTFESGETYTVETTVTKGEG